MRRWNLRKYGYILVWLALAGAVGLAWLLGRDAPPTAGAGETSSAAAPAPSEAEPSPDQENLVGLWVPYFSLSTEEGTKAAFEENYKAIVRRAKEQGVNAMFVHVRPFSDSLYPSARYPWSHVLTGEQGKDPGFDPLALRVKTAQTPGALSPESPYEKWKEEHPYYFMEWEGGVYLDPAYPEVRSLIAQGVGEIVENYQVDGVHFDDYFYPSQDPSLDGGPAHLEAGQRKRLGEPGVPDGEGHQGAGGVWHFPPGEHRERPSYGGGRDRLGGGARVRGLPVPPALLQL